MINHNISFVNCSQLWTQDEQISMASGNTIGMCGYPKYTKHTCAFTYMLAMCARVFTCVSLCVLVITAIAIAHRKLRFFLKKTKSSTRGFIRLAPQHDANVRRHVFMLQISSPTDARDYLNICTCVCFTV